MGEARHLTDAPAQATRFADAMLAANSDEAARREHGPICALCGHSPLEVADLPPLELGSPTGSVSAFAMRRFFCEPRGRQCSADSGRGCASFYRATPR